MQPQRADKRALVGLPGHGQPHPAAVPPQQKGEVTVRSGGDSVDRAMLTTRQSCKNPKKDSVPPVMQIKDLSVSDS